MSGIDLFDPWADAKYVPEQMSEGPMDDPWKDYRPTSAPRAQLVSSLNPEAKEFHPILSLDVLISTDAQDIRDKVDLYATISNAQMLIDAQNNTIAFLCSQLEAGEVFPVASDDRLAARVEELCNSLSAYIDCLPAMPPRRISTARVDRQRKPGDVCRDDARALLASDAPASARDAVPSLSELDKANNIILELRSQNASQAASAARRADMREHGRLLQTLHIPSGALDSNFPIADVFLKFVGSATEVDIRDPYLISKWQVGNLASLLDALVARSHVRVARLTSNPRSRSNDGAFADLATRMSGQGLALTWAYQPDLHLREVVFSNGVAVVPDRGLDLYRAPTSDGLRFCRNATVLYYELNDTWVAASSNVAAKIADEARSLVADGVAKDVTHIKAMMKTAPSSSANQRSVTTLRHQLELEHVASTIKEMGYTFVNDQFSITHFMESIRRSADDDLDTLLTRVPRLLREIHGYGFVTRCDVSGWGGSEPDSDALPSAFLSYGDDLGDDDELMPAPDLLPPDEALREHIAQIVHNKWETICLRDVYAALTEIEGELDDNRKEQVKRILTKLFDDRQDLTNLTK